MKTKFINAPDLIYVEQMLSSSTYYASLYNRCIYCHDEVENDETVKWEGNTYHPYRCDCERAQHELFLKGKILYDLKELERLNDSADDVTIRNAIDTDEAAMEKEYQNMKPKERRI